MSTFQLDSRLARDTVYIAALPLCDVRVMNDSRWPWLILVPRIEGAEEIHTLTRPQQTQIATETAHASATLKTLTRCTKINTAAIGNIVRQLHIHVIARNEQDPNWPGPVCGYGQRLEYEKSVLENMVSHVQNELCHHTGFSILNIDTVDI